MFHLRLVITMVHGFGARLSHRSLAIEALVLVRCAGSATRLTAVRTDRSTSVQLVSRPLLLLYFIGGAVNSASAPRGPGDIAKGQTFEQPAPAEPQEDPEEVKNKVSNALICWLRSPVPLRCVQDV